MSTPLGLNIDITVELTIRDGGVVLRAFNSGTEIARGVGPTVTDAVPALVSFFAELQGAAIEAMYNGGLISRPAPRAEQELSS